MTITIIILLCTGLSESALHSNSTLPDNKDNAQGSLVIDPNIGLALVTIQNSSAGVSVTVRSACPPQQHQCSSLLVHSYPSVFMPSECQADTCDDILIIVDEPDISNNNIMHYTLMVPVVKATLLLKFEYRINTQYLKLKESRLVSTEAFGCNPVVSVSAGRSYYTVCEDSSLHQLVVLELENAQNVSEAFYVRSTDDLIPFDPNSHLSGVRGINSSSYDKESPYKIIFGIGIDFCVADISEVFEVECIPFTDCQGSIAQFHSGPLTSQYTLLYCQTKYGIVDISLDNSDVTSNNYSVVGYPVVCPSVTSLLNITRISTQTVLHYLDKAIPLIGDSVIVNRTKCFEVSGHLFFMYTDLELGVFLLSLKDEEWHSDIISLSVCPTESTDSCSSPKVFNQQYVLLQEGTHSSMDQNTTLKVFDVLQSKVVSVNKITFSPDIVIVLKVPPVPTSNTAIIRNGILIGVIILVLIISGTVISW